MQHGTAFCHIWQVSVFCVQALTFKSFDLETTFLSCITSSEYLGQGQGHKSAGPILSCRVDFENVPREFLVCGEMVVGQSSLACQLFRAIAFFYKNYNYEHALKFHLSLSQEAFSTQNAPNVVWRSANPFAVMGYERERRGKGRKRRGSGGKCLENFSSE